MIELYIVGCLIMYGVCSIILKNEKMEWYYTLLMILFSWITVGAILGYILNIVDDTKQQNKTLLNSFYGKQSKKVYKQPTGNSKDIIVGKCTNNCGGGIDKTGA